MKIWFNRMLSAILPLQSLNSAWQYRELITGMSKREVLGRYRGSWLGMFWSLLTPILLLLVYMFVFGVIFKARWPQPEGLEDSFAPLLFCGIIVYMAFAEVLTSSPKLIVMNANYVKKVVFPLDILSWVAIVNTLFHFFISLFVLMIFVLFLGNGLSWTLVYLPILITLFAINLLGLAWLLSACGVYIRDITYIAGFISTAMMFLSPVFYPRSAVPEKFGIVMDLNPLTFYIEAFRDVVVLGREPELSSLFLAGVASLLSFVIGYWFFQRVRKGFADVL